MMLFIQETRFNSPDYYHKYSSYYFSYLPKIGQFHSMVILSMRATIKNYTENIWGFNKQFKQDNLTFVQTSQKNIVSPQNRTNPFIWKNPTYSFQLYNNLGDDEIEVYTIIPKTVLDGIVQIGAIVGLYGVGFSLLILVNRHLINKRKQKYFQKYQKQVKDRESQRFGEIQLKNMLNQKSDGIQIDQVQQFTPRSVFSMTQVEDENQEKQLLITNSSSSETSNKMEAHHNKKQHLPKNDDQTNDCAIKTQENISIEQVKDTLNYENLENNSEGMTEVFSFENFLKINQEVKDIKTQMRLLMSQQTQILEKLQ
eukprot:403353862